MSDTLTHVLREGLTTLWPVWLVLGLVLALRVALVIYKRQRLLRSGIYAIDEMTGPTFERYLETLFRNLGYRVRRIGATGDFGADLIVSKNGVRTVVQAKRYRKNVGVRAIQEVVAAKKMYNCQRAMVVTNSGFTKPARELAAANATELWDRERLIAMSLAARKAAR